MPWGDRIGPLGMGPRKGRRLGFCSGFSTPGFLKGAGWGWRKSCGLGRGWRWFWMMNYFPEEAISPAKEKEILKDEAESLKRRLAEIERRLAELETK